MSLIKTILSRLLRSLLKRLGLYRISQISPKQLERVNHYRRKWETIATSTTPMDRLRVERAIAVFYRANGLSLPEIRMFEGPQSLKRADEAQPAERTIAGQFKHLQKVQSKAAISQFDGDIAIFLIHLIPVLIAPYLVITSFYPQRWIEAAFVNFVFFSLVQWLQLNLFAQLGRIAGRFTGDFHGLWLIYYYVGAPVILAAYLWPNNPFQAKIIAGCYLVMLLYRIGTLRLAQPYPMPWVPSTATFEQRINQGISNSILDELQNAFRPMLVQPRGEYQLDQGAFRLWAQNYTSIIANARDEWIAKNQRGYQLYQNFQPSFQQHDLPPQEQPEGIVLAEQLFWFSYMDFCISELRCEHQRELWDALKVMMEECGWILPLEGDCWVCERPQAIHCNAEGQFHNLAGPAIAFADQTHIYVHNGVQIPAEYGQLPSHQWKSQWILTEPNAEVRRLLIEAIGYERLCKEQEATVLDSWREYELLRFTEHLRQPDHFQARFTEEPINLLKMTCPSTDHIHVIRVPPQLDKARDAARWINWDVDPESFAVET